MHSTKSYSKEVQTRNILLCVTFIDLLGFGILLPMIPFIALEVQANSFEIGCLAAVFPFFQMLMMPFWGHCADKWGSKPILIISLLGSAISFALFAFSSVYWGLLLSRILAGSTSATLGVVRGALTAPGDKSTTQKNMNLFGAAQGVGFLLGPALGAGMQIVSLRAPIWVAASFCLLVVPFLIAQTNLPKANASSDESLLLKLRTALSNQQLAKLNSTYFFVYFAFAFLFISFPLMLKQAYGYGAHESAIYFSIMSISAVTGQLALLPQLQKRFSNRAILMTAMTMLPFEIKMMGTTATGLISGILLAITSLSLFVCIPTLMAEIGVRSNEKKKMFVAAYTESISGLARLLGTAVSGIVIQIFSVGRAFDFSALIVVVGLFTFLFDRASVHESKKQA